MDQHHLESLHEILAKWNLISLQDDGTAGEGSLWTEDGLQELNLVWHRLAPWPDTCEGLQELKRQVYTCTLTNGNLSLIQAMCANGNMGFTHIYSAEMFESYKPNPKIYLGVSRAATCQTLDVNLVLTTYAHSRLRRRWVLNLKNALWSLRILMT